MVWAQKHTKNGRANHMANTNEKGETSSRAYARNMTEVFDKLEKINRHLLDESVDAKKANWGDVGSAAHLNDLLGELSEFIGIKEGRKA